MKRRVVLFRSMDDGRTFIGPVDVGLGEGKGLAAYNLLVLSDGTLVVPMSEYPNYAVEKDASTWRAVLALSTDGGVTFSPRKPIAEINFGGLKKLREQQKSGRIDQIGGPVFAADIESKVSRPDLRRVDGPRRRPVPAEALALERPRRNVEQAAARRPRRARDVVAVSTDDRGQPRRRPRRLLLQHGGVSGSQEVRRLLHRLARRRRHVPAQGPRLERVVLALRCRKSPAGAVRAERSRAGHHLHALRALALARRRRLHRFDGRRRRRVPSVLDGRPQRHLSALQRRHPRRVAAGEETRTRREGASSSDRSRSSSIPFATTRRRGRWSCPSV